jgi:integrase
MSCETDDWDIAVQTREEWLARTEGCSVPESADAPTFSEICDLYLDRLSRGVGEYKPSTIEDRECMLGDGKHLRAAFAHLRIDEITPRVLADWWESAVISKGRAYATGRNYLDALAGLFTLAFERGWIDESPVDDFRRQLSRGNRTAAHRARRDPKQNVHPWATTELGAFLTESERLGGAGYIVSLLLADAGLRLGEALALDWSDVHYGRDSDDRERHLAIRASLSRGRHPGTTKTGVARTVALPRRLRTALRDEWVRRGQPETGRVALIDASNYRNRHFRRACDRAGLGHRMPKDLRDTFASLLADAGVRPTWVQAQLGHSDLTLTSRYYLKEGSEDRDPMPRLPGEVWSDLLARMEEPEPNPFENSLRTPDAEKCQPSEPHSEESGVVSKGWNGDPGRIRICDFRLRRLG